MIVSKLITEYGVFEFKEGKTILIELYKGESIETIKTLTDIDFLIADDILTTLQCKRKCTSEK